MMAVMGSNWTGSVFIGLILALVAGALVGVVNGVVIARLRINALITTLATMQIVRGLALISSDGRAVGVNDPGFYTHRADAAARHSGADLGDGGELRHFRLRLQPHRFRAKRLWRSAAIRTASRLAGVNVDRTRIWIFAIQGSDVRRSPAFCWPRASPRANPIRRSGSNSR